MGYILLGHGGLDVDPSVTPQDMEFVAIPAGTTLQFYADSGQGLAFGSSQLDVWEQLQAPWPALDSSRVTYNLSLYSAKELWPNELRNNPSFGGHTLIRASVDGVPDPIRMCTGTRDTCPTDPRQVAAGQTHTCDGILGTYAGDLYWLACTSFSNVDQATTNETLAGQSASPLLGEDPDWLPDDEAYAAVAEVNGANVKAASDGEELEFVIGGFLMTIGQGHTDQHKYYAAFQPDRVDGKVTIQKGGVFSAGTLSFTNVPPAKQGLVEDSVGRFSEKSVEFA